MNKTAEELARKEARRLTKIVKGYDLSKDKLSMLKPVIDNVAFMKVKLDDAREAIRESSVAIQYDNGGGQSGIRENPIFKGYESLWKSYVMGMNRIIDCIPDEEEKKEIKDEREHAPTALEIIRSRHIKEA